MANAFLHIEVSLDKAEYDDEYWRFIDRPCNGWQFEKMRFDQVRRQSKVGRGWDEDG